MECRVSSVENDLGIDRKQLVFGEGAQIVAFVSLKWLSGLKERKVLLSCPRPEGVTEAEITTFLQPSVNKLPAGWTRISIQSLRKSRLRHHLWPSSCSPTGWSGDAGGVGGELDLDSLSGFMKHVADQNYRNLWREAHGKYVRPHAAGSEKTGTCCLESMKRALSRLLGCSFIPIGDDSSLTKDPEPSPFHAIREPHPNLLPAEALLESTHFLYVIQPFSRYSLRDVVTYSPAKLSSSHAKVLFILFQVLHAMRACHHQGLTCGSLSLNHLMVDERLCTQLQLSLSDYERPECVELTGGKAGEGGSEWAAPSHQQEELSGLLTDWLRGGISNFSYLMGLNRLAGRRAGDPNYHPVLPWVVDFTIPYGRFRDLRKSKFRLNKGDKQLDFTYEMTKEAFVAGGQAGEQLHVPHHISDILSDITYYVYKARRTPRSVLCSHVRSQWEPNEYPASMERVQSWTPDECIPEFYTDPTIFQSIHPDMPDLDIPNWCGSYQEFIDIHRKLLESKEVSSNLHHWIDLTFGYKLTGKEAVKAKNVCLHLVDGHSHLTSYGVVQLFEQPHPPRLAGASSAPPEAPIITHNLKKVAEQHAEIRASSLINGMVPETAGSEGAWPERQGSGDPFKEEDLEEGTEALDSLSAPDKPLEQLSPVGVSGLSTAAPRISVRVSRNRGAADQELREARISLPDGFNALQALEELEKSNNFLVRGLYSQLPEGRQPNPTLHLSYSQFVQRDMQAFGVLIGEISFAPRLRALGQNASLLDRFLAVRKLCLHHTKEIAAPLQHVTSSLLQLHRSCEELLKTRVHGEQVSLFDYAPVFEGLPPPSPAQLLTPCCPIIPFPFYFNSLHQFVCTYYSHWAENVEQGRDFVFSLWQQLDSLLEKMQPEGLEILLPFILGLMSDSLTAVYAAWYFFEPVACALGPRNAYRYLLKPLVGVYEKPGYLCGRFYLYTDCFIVQLIVRLGLQPFLNSLLPHILQVLTGQEGAEESRVLGVVADDEEGVSDSPDSYSSGDLKGAAEHRSSSFADFSSGISFSDQAELPESEDFQNGIFLSEQESVSLGKLSNKSSNSDTSAEDRGTDSDSKERPSPHSAGGSQDLKLAESLLQLGELEDEEDEEAAFGSLPVSDPRESETLPKGESLEEEEEEQEEEEEEDLSEGKEQKILLGK
ncbi:hypothetical protein scyTo_0022502 [Scyliorhinus torazame]|uniref:BEACH domain-containing protein n=1 Tax=Scyliorhinus torazame TaxID=75743 RepID=A0A401Q7N4_SCYTO|nr:hypothetical protein [Scyliorhinus torazame]